MSAKNKITFQQVVAFLKQKEITSTVPGAGEASQIGYAASMIADLLNDPTSRPWTRQQILEAALKPATCNPQPAI